MQRPGTAHTSHMPLPASAQLARVRPQSAAPRLQPYSQPGTFSEASSYSTKSNAQKNIDGELGPKMIGVTTYPYSNPQRQYLQDFRALAAKTITHPYIATAGNNTGSSPHDLLAGAAARRTEPRAASPCAHTRDPTWRNGASLRRHQFRRRSFQCTEEVEERSRALVHQKEHCGVEGGVWMRHTIGADHRLAGCRPTSPFTGSRGAD